VVQTAPIGILVENEEGRVELVNRTGVEHIAVGQPEDWIGRPMKEMGQHLMPRISDPSQKRALVREASQAGRVLHDMEILLREPDQKTLLLFVSAVFSDEGERLGRVWLTRDVTEERRLEEQLRQSQKLETIGTLSGGIAHDFNNQLAVILGNVRYVQAHPDVEVAADCEIHESLADLERAADHCAGLTRSLLAFARRAPVAIQPLDTGGVIEDLMDLVRPLIPSSISIELDVEGDLPRVAADPTQLQQVLLNLAVNARDAMKEQGELRVAVRATRVSAERARDVAGGRPGEFIEIGVTDTGTGLDPASLDRIFEPFFTTKPVGEGTGLGLAIVHGVVTAHHGWLEVESRVGCGTTFRVLLPIAEVRLAADEVQGPTLRAPSGRLVLVVDDEPGIRRLVRLALESSGHVVLEAGDGAEALRLFDAQPDLIDLIVMDLTMPKLDGLSARAEILSRGHATPMVLCSGQAPDLAVAEAMRAGGCLFLQKPYAQKQLQRAIGELLEAKAHH
jgi:two-component system cell cycle sensor histidine kinase/response regulator CckA